MPRSVIFFLLSFFVLGAVAGDGFVLREVHEKCGEENHLSPEEYEQLNKTRHIETDDQRLKCFIKCVLTNIKLMNEEGELTLENASDPMFRHRNHFPACKDVTGTDVCDKALKFKNCIWKEIDSQGGAM